MKQVPLALSAPRTWGGSREGAGRKPAHGKRVPHVEKPWHDRTKPVHVTVPIVAGIRLRDLAIARAIGTSLRALVGAPRESHFRIAAFSIQSTHVHLIVEAGDRVALSNGMRSVTVRIAKAVQRALGRRGPVVRDRYHAHVLETPTEAHNALLYVLDNGRKHGEPDDEFVDGLDTRSSARWNLGRAPGPSPVSSPRTYFMRAGWKKARPRGRPPRPAR